MKDKKALLDKVRKKLRDSKGSKRDPNMFRVPNVKANDDPLKYRFIVLPPLAKGDKCVEGKATAGMDDMFCLSGGQHWINNKPYGCPRQFDGDDCPWCTVGFNMMNECDIDEERKKIRRQYLPRSIFAVNIYFPPFKENPSDLHGKVMWYPMPKTIYDKMEDCLMREDAGDDPENDPHPYGMFYDPEDCLVFQVMVTHKGGYNNYEKSKFLLKRSSLAADEEATQTILDQRFDLVAKFPTRNTNELEQLLNKLASGSVDARDEESKDEESKDEEKPTPSKAEEEEDVLPPSRKEKDAEKPKAKAPEVSVDEIDDPELKELISEVQDEA
jgi:hypothetical protein